MLVRTALSTVPLTAPIATGARRFRHHAWQLVTASGTARRFTVSSQTAPAFFWHQPGCHFPAAVGKPSKSAADSDIKIWSLEEVAKNSKVLSQSLHVEGLGSFQVPLIVDVREPDEYAAGRIPAAINVPLSVLKAVDGADPGPTPETFRQQVLAQVSADDRSQAELIFQPARESSEGEPVDRPGVVVYCRAGVRSAVAAEILHRRLGKATPALRVGDYRGSWLDWVQNGGATEV